MRRLLPAAVFVLLLPGLGTAAKPGPAVDAAGWKHFLENNRIPKPTHGLRFERVESTLDLVEPDAFELRTTVSLTRTSSSPRSLALVEIDPTLGETCRIAVDDAPEIDDPDEEEETLGLELTVSDPDARGIATCSVALPSGNDPVQVEIRVRRPRINGLDDRFAFRMPVQPLVAPADHLVFAVESFAESEPTVQLLRWDTELRKQALDRGRLRVFFEIEGVQARAESGGIRSLAGRLPEVVVTSGEPWDDVALDHRLQYLAAGRATGPVIAMAGRVLARGGGLPSVVEAVQIALDEVELDPLGGGGGTWRLPQSAQYTLEEKRGTAADRAALLIALLRTADVRAEIVLTSADGQEPKPGSLIPVLDRTLVYVPDAAVVPGRALFIDPSLSSAWLGETDELLAGRSAVMLAPEGARWLRLPSDDRASSWSLRATEGEDGQFAISLTGRLQGPAAARVRQWERAGRPPEGIPTRDLSWAAGRWAPLLELSISDTTEGRVIVQATGTVAADAVAGPDGSITPPPLPTVRHGAPSKATSEIFGVDTDMYAFDLRESWRFQGRQAGSGSPSLKRTTPFWEARSYGSWSGPLFNRETVVRWKGRHLSPNATTEPERLAEQLAEIFREVKPPTRAAAAP
jgi:transglutaminase-like putative cysteine protease